MHKNLLVCFLEPVEFPVAINWNSNHFRATGWTDEWILPQKFAFFWLAVHVLQETPLKSVCIHVFGLKWKNHRTGFNDNNLIDHQSCYIVQKNVCKDFVCTAICGPWTSYLHKLNLSTTKSLLWPYFPPLMILITIIKASVFSFTFWLTRTNCLVLWSNIAVKACLDIPGAAVFIASNELNRSWWNRVCACIVAGQYPLLTKSETSGPHCLLQCRHVSEGKNGLSSYWTR